MKLFSPAKVNLFLHVRRKRKDGYHELETLFERLDFGDDLFLSEASDISLTVEGPEKVPAGPSNLAWRAAELLRAKSGTRRGVKIRLVKRIPVSAGLGGGSSNAAAVLLGLNRFWKLGWSREKLLKLAAELGSDVPFFILEAPLALATGRGEKLRKLPFSGRPFQHVLVKPPFGISTKEAYGGLKPPFLTPKKADVRMLVHSIQKGTVDTLPNPLTNSLEGALNKRVRAIEKIKQKLVREGASAALLSGSGSCVFGLFSSRRKASEAARRLKRTHSRWKVFTASTY